MYCTSTDRITERCNLVANRKKLNPYVLPDMMSYCTAAKIIANKAETLRNSGIVILRINVWFVVPYVDTVWKRTTFVTVSIPEARSVPE